MARIKKVVLSFDMLELTGVFGFRVYYYQGDWNEESPFIDIPLVAGQTAYDLEFPTLINLAEGTWNLGVCALDEAGNEGDMDVLNRFFDFTPPGKPIWRR